MPNLLYASNCRIRLQYHLFQRWQKYLKGISEHELDTTTTWYLSEDNTIEANDKVVAFIDSLEISNSLLKYNPKYNHTSSDGQKV